MIFKVSSKPNTSVILWSTYSNNTFLEAVVGCFLTSTCMCNTRHLQRQNPECILPYVCFTYLNVEETYVLWHFVVPTGWKDRRQIFLFPWKFSENFENLKVRLYMFLTQSVFSSLESYSAQLLNYLANSSTTVKYLRSSKVHLRGKK